MGGWGVDLPLEHTSAGIWAMLPATLARIHQGIEIIFSQHVVVRPAATRVLEPGVKEMGQ